MTQFSVRLLCAVLLAAPTVREVAPAVRTEALDADPDDPAIWINRNNPAGSLILGTKKVAAPSGALVVFGLDGKILQTVSGVDRPNNVDIEGDLAILTERNQKRLRAFRVSPNGVKDLGGVPVFEGETGTDALPMGIGLYRRPRDGAIFAIVSRKSGPSGRYLWQYRIADRGDRIEATKVREFGEYSGGADNEIEAVAVDDALGYVYYADEAGGIRKYHADPGHPEASRVLAYFGREGFQANREGIAIYARPNGSGFLICTDQLKGNSQYRIFRREGRRENPHDHSDLVGVVAGGADSTDGLDATAEPLGPAFPRGLVIAMSSASRNFLIYRAEAFLGPAARR